MPTTPFREDQGRLNVENFYYAQEDEVFAAAEREGFGWSVHRPHTIIGYAVGNAMNLGVTLASYAYVVGAVAPVNGNPGPTTFVSDTQMSVSLQQRISLKLAPCC